MAHKIGYGVQCTKKEGSLDEVIDPPFFNTAEQNIFQSGNRDNILIP